ncbi:MAG TPA: PAS domain S-box protein [Pyrinomonadaceae bacterium]|nr:PAS domain S-box protein [Pyrinomonadaceae bacterium]
MNDDRKSSHTSRPRTAVEAEIALERAVCFYEALLGSMGEGLYTVDATGAVATMNQAAERMLGWTFEELRGRKMHDAIHYKHRDGTPFKPEDCAGYRVLKSGTAVFDQDDVFIRRDGTFLDVRYSSSPIVEAGETTGLVVVFRDATARKIIENRLRESEERFQKFMQHLPGLAWIKDGDGRYIFANAAAEAAFQKPMKELAGKSDEEIFPPETAAAFVENDRLALESDTGRQATETIVDEKGILRYSLVSKFPIPTADGQSPMVGGMAIDITEQKRAEKNHEFLFAIAEKIRLSRNPEELLADIARLLGEYLDVHRCLFNEIDLENDTEIVHNDYFRTGSSVAGKHKISAYSSITSESMITGQTVVNRDSQHDPRTAELFKKVYGPSNELAYIAVPLLREEKWVASLWCSDDKPHDWTDQEIGLLEGIAERAWSAVERMRAEEAKARLAAIVESSDDAIVSKDLNGIVSSWNRGAEKLFGYKAEEVVGKSITILMPPDRVGEEEQILSRIRKGECVEPYETIRRRKDGTLLYISLTVSPIYDATGKIVGASKVARNITERIKAQAALRASEERYRTLFDSMDEGYCIIEMIFNRSGQPVDYRFVEVNRAFEIQSGLHDVTGRRISAFVSNIEEHWLRNYSEVALTGVPVRFSGEFKGLSRSFEVYAFRVGEPSDHKVAVLFTDITHRNAAEAALRASEERSRISEYQLRLITDSIPALVSYVGADERYKFVNRTYCDWFGLPKEKIVGKKLQTILGGRAYRELKGKLDEALAGKTVTFEANVHYKSAGNRFISAAYVPDTSDEGDVRGFYALITDVSDLKRSEELLRSSQDRMRVLTESFTDYAIFSTDIEGRIDSWNPGAANIFGYEEGEILGRSYEMLFTSEDVANGIPLREMRTARKSGRASDERWQTRKDGTRFFAAGVMAPLYVGKTLSGYAKITSDLTEKQRYAEALQHSHDLLELRVVERTRELAAANAALVSEINERKTAERQKIEFLQRLVTSQEDQRQRIARDLHDQLGQRLTALRLKIAAMKEVCSHDENLKARAVRLQEVAELLDSEVSFLAWELRPFALDELGLVDAIGTFVREWSKHYEIPAEFHSSGLANVPLDESSDSHLYRIAQEALNNIVKHSRASAVNVLLEKTGDELVLIVEDNGVGMKPSERSNGRKGGKGLGLEGMRERASLIGGSLEIESAPGAGTTVYARIPLRKEK